MLEPLIDLDVVLRDHCDSLAAAPGTCGSPDPVDVVFPVAGKVEVDDDVDRRYIETSARDVRTDQYVAPARLKLR